MRGLRRHHLAEMNDACSEGAGHRRWAAHPLQVQAPLAEQADQEPRGVQPHVQPLVVQLQPRRLGDGREGVPVGDPDQVTGTEGPEVVSDYPACTATLPIIYSVDTHT